MRLAPASLRRIGTQSGRRAVAALLTVLMVSTGLFVASPQAEAFPTDVAWGSIEHGYRVPVDISSAAGGTDLVAVADLDFTTAFAEAAAEGSTFDPATLRVHEVDASGNVLDTEVQFQFDADPSYEATSAATGELVIALAGASYANTARHFAVYFDESGVTTTPVTVAPVLTVDAAAYDEGLPVAHIATATTDWYYDLFGGGFTSIVDAVGNDWISYSTAAESAGEFRGLPNLVFPQGHFHPGSTSALTTVDSTGPLRATLSSTTGDGWELRWEFFASHARATVVNAPGNYWFLYEGTPGGALDPGDIVVAADGGVTNAADPFDGDILGDEWVAFADPGVGRSIFVANHEDDGSNDTYYAMNGEMTVFGFGREGLGTRLSGADRSFSVGLIDAVDHATLSPVVAAAHAPPVAIVGPAENSSVGTYQITTPIEGDGTVTLSPDQATYLDGDVVTLTATPTAGQSFLGWSGDVTSSEPVIDVTIAGASITTTASFTSSAIGSGFVSDDFDAESLAAQWSFVDPVNDSALNLTGAGSGQATATLSIPAGTSHDAYGINNSPRLMQPIANADFEIEAAFLSTPSQQYQLNGILVEQDSANWIRFDAYHDGGQLLIHAAQTTANTTSTVFNSPAPATTRFFRLNRTGTTWTGSYSSDGSSWTQAGIFTHALTATSAGVFAGNAGPSPAYDGIVDYVFESDSPIEPEDGTTTYPITADVVGNGDVTMSPDQPTYVDGQVVTLTATPGSGESFIGWTGDITSSDPVIDITIAGAPVAVTASFTAAVASSGFVSDDFNTLSLGNHWTFVDPVGDAAVSTTGAGSGQATATLSVPAGTSHDAYGVNNAARLMQPIADVDFELEAAFESAPSQQYQLNGILVEQDPANWIRFDAYHDGNALRVHAARTSADIPTTVFSIAAPADVRFFRLDRSGNTWTGRYSTDGTTWIVAGSFTHAITVNSAGVFVGNAGPSPAYDGIVDYVFETSARIDPEDPAFTAHAIDVTTTGNGSATKSPEQSSYLPGEIVTLTAVPDAGESFLGWSGDVTSSNPTIEVTVPDADIAVTAAFTTAVSSFGFISDDFDSATLDGHWSFVDPVGDVAVTVDGAGTGHAVATLAIPSGTSHDAYGLNNAARLMQPASDVDFELEAAFESLPSQRYQHNGILVEQDPSTWIRFGATHDGTTLRIFAAHTTADVSTTAISTAIPGDARLFRLNRTGDLWTGFYSSDGTNWTEAGSFVFAINVTAAGVLAGNAGPSPAYAAIVDYVFDTATPIDPEDGAAHSVDTSVVGGGSITKTPDQPGYLDGTTISLTAAPDAGQSFVGWSGDVTSTDPTIEVTMAGTSIVLTATFTENIVSSGFVSDDFDSADLGTQWGFVDPVGNSAVTVSGVGTGDAQATLAVPAGTAHDAYGVNNSARLVQPINDVDFELEAAFESVPSQRYQLNGILVEQDEANWLRFDVYHDGAKLRVYAGRTTGNTTASMISKVVPADTRFFRLNRSGNSWTGSYSSDGISWTEAGSFDFSINVTSAGVFAGNAGPSPAFDGIVDYVFDTAAPIDPEDNAVAYPVTTSVIGDGMVTRSPDHASYVDGTIVSLTAEPDIGASFIEWTGDVTSTNPVIDVTIDGAPVDVTATFTTAPASYPVDVTVAGHGSVAKSPDQVSYVDGDTVQLTATAASGETFTGWTGDVTSTIPVIDVTVDGAPVAVTATFSATTAPSGFVSDDFDAASLGNQWTFVDPVGNSTVETIGAGTGDATAVITVAGGSNHDAYNINRSARIMQPINDTDFELEAAFETSPSQRYQINGILIEQDSSKWIRFDAYHDASGLRVYAGETLGDTTHTKFRVNAPFDTRFFRLDRTGNTWTGHYSSDGTSWTQAGTFTSAITPTAAGVFVGNAGPNPEYASVVDYIFDTAAPIIPEDDSFVAYPVNVAVVGSGVITKSPDQAAYASGSVVQLTATPDSGELFTGWTGDVTSSDPTINVTVVDAAVDLTAHFVSSASGFASDDFNTPVLDSNWTFVDPIGDSVLSLAGTGTGQATVSIAVPAGTAHDAFGATNNAARLMQPIANTDIELEVGFDSIATQRFQTNGLLIEQDSLNWIRFDAYHDDTNLNVYAATTVDGSSQTEFNVVAPLDTKYLRINRTGDVWTGYYSSDGVAWTQAGSFTMALDTSSAGVFAGNAGPSPAYTAIIDYVFETSSPVDPEDGTSAYSITVDTTGDGTVSKSPDQALYSDGASVQLTASPDGAETFLGWTGDITSPDPVIDVIIAGSSIDLTANFTTAPASYPVDVTVEGNGTVEKSPDQTDYPDGSTVQITATPDTGEVFVGWSGDISSTDPVIDVTISGAPVDITATFSEAVAASGFISDDFDNSVLGGHWTFVDPIGDAAVSVNGAGSGQATLELTVPGGGAHDAWGVNNSARVVQPIDDVDFELQIGLESLPSQQFQANGILVEQDATNWIRFDTYSDGTDLRVFAARTLVGSSSSRFNVVVPNDTKFLRLSRTGDNWTGYYSSDATTWFEAGSFSFVMTVSSAGVFVSNAGPSPAYTAVVDYIFDTTTPIVPEDDTSTYPVNVITVGNGTVTKAPDLASYADGTVVQLTASPDAGESFIGWTGDVTSSNSVIDVTISGAPVSVTATFTSPTTGSGFTSDDFDTASLASQWTFVDPIGDSSFAIVGAGTGNAALHLSVPGGTAHDVWGATKNAARVMQAIDDTNFTLAAGFDSVGTQQFQSNGILVEQDATNWLRFDIYSDTSSVRVFAASTTNAASTSRFNIVAPTDTKFLRLTRSGDVWTGEYSTDGSSWTTAGSFTYAMTPSEAGVFAANAGAKPAYTAIVDYIFDTAAPIIPEDGTTTYAVTTSATGDGSVSRSPDQPSYPDGSTVQLTATPDPGATFIDWSGDISSTNPVIDVSIAGGPVSVTANFTNAPASYPIDVTLAGAGAVTKSPNQSTYVDGSVVQLTAVPDAGESFVGWSGDITSTNPNETVTVNGASVAVTAHFTGETTGIDVWYGSAQTFGDDGNTQRWVNILGNASDPDGIASLRYRLNGGPLLPLNVGGDLRRIYNTGDFNVEIDSVDLSVGTNSVLIVLNDSTGETTTELVNVTWAPTTPSTSYSIDWSAASDVQDGAQIVDGKWGIDNGSLRTLETGYDRTVTLGDLTWQDFEIEVPVTIHSLGPGSGTPQSGEPLVGLGMRWQGHSVTGTQPNYGFYPTGAFAWWRTNVSGNRLEMFGNNNSPNDKVSSELSFGTTYIFKARAETISGATEYKFKVWEQGQAEPSTWTVGVIDTDSPASGSIVLIAHHFDVSFGNVTVTPL